MSRHAYQAKFNSTRRERSTKQGQKQHSFMLASVTIVCLCLTGRVIITNTDASTAQLPLVLVVFVHRTAKLRGSAVFLQST